MTADLTAIVEAVTSALGEHSVKKRNSYHVRCTCGYVLGGAEGSRPSLDAHRADVATAATLKAALGPLADEAETWAKHCDEQGDFALVASKDKEAARAYQARDTHNSYAKRLRALAGESS